MAHRVPPLPGETDGVVGARPLQSRLVHRAPGLFTCCLLFLVCSLIVLGITQSQAILCSHTVVPPRTNATTFSPQRALGAATHARQRARQARTPSCVQGRRGEHCRLIAEESGLAHRACAFPGKHTINGMTQRLFHRPPSSSLGFSPRIAWGSRGRQRARTRGLRAT